LGGFFGQSQTGKERPPHRRSLYKASGLMNLLKQIKHSFDNLVCPAGKSWSRNGDRPFVGIIRIVRTLIIIAPIIIVIVLIGIITRATGMTGIRTGTILP